MCTCIHCIEHLLHIERHVAIIIGCGRENGRQCVAQIDEPGFIAITDRTLEQHTVVTLACHSVKPFSSEAGESSSEMINRCPTATMKRGLNFSARTSLIPTIRRVCTSSHSSGASRTGATPGNGESTATPRLVYHHVGSVQHTGATHATNRVSGWMRRMLYRTIDLVPDSGYAARQTGGHALRPVERRQPVHAVWSSRATGSVHIVAAGCRDVRNNKRGSVYNTDCPGAYDIARVVEDCIDAQRP